MELRSGPFCLEADVEKTRLFYESLVEEGFPRPILQMEIGAELPWVLSEPNPYR